MSKFLDITKDPKITFAQKIFHNYCNFSINDYLIPAQKTSNLSTTFILDASHNELLPENQCYIKNFYLNMDKDDDIHHINNVKITLKRDKYGEDDIVISELTGELLNLLVQKNPSYMGNNKLLNISQSMMVISNYLTSNGYQLQIVVNWKTELKKVNLYLELFVCLSYPEFLSTKNAAQGMYYNKSRICTHNISKGENILDLFPNDEKMSPLFCRAIALDFSDPGEYNGLLQVKIKSSRHRPILIFNKINSQLIHNITEGNIYILSRSMDSVWKDLFEGQAKGHIIINEDSKIKINSTTDTSVTITIFYIDKIIYHPKFVPSHNLYKSGNLGVPHCCINNNKTIELSRELISTVNSIEKDIMSICIKDNQ